MCVPVNSYQFKFFLFLTESSPVICQNLIKIFSNVDMTLITPLSSDEYRHSNAQILYFQSIAARETEPCSWNGVTS